MIVLLQPGDVHAGVGSNSTGSVAGPVTPIIDGHGAGPARRLTHVYAKLGLTSRVQLVAEAARHV